MYQTFAHQRRLLNKHWQAFLQRFLLWNIIHLLLYFSQKRQKRNKNCYISVQFLRPAPIRAINHGRGGLYSAQSADHPSNIGAARARWAAADSAGDFQWFILATAVHSKSWLLSSYGARCYTHGDNSNSERRRAWKCGRKMTMRDVRNEKWHRVRERKGKSIASRVAHKHTIRYIEEPHCFLSQCQKIELLVYTSELAKNRSLLKPHATKILIAIGLICSNETSIGTLNGTELIIIRFWI